MSGIITLTTDFGLQDHYVAAMKAVILSTAPRETRIVDISHEIPPQDVMAGAWVVRNAAPLFPDGTIHVVVVDPGVGTDRRPVAVRMDRQIFVGPDNGIFSLLAEQAPYEVRHLTNRAFWRNDEPSRTFHGRDLFAPVAAHLSRGVPFSEVGDTVDGLQTYRWARPIADKAGIQGWIVHIDRYGNLISNIPESLIREYAGDSSLKIYVGNTILDGLSVTFGSVEEGDPVAYIGSSGVLEVAINKGSARELLGVKKGAQISLVVKK